MLLVLIFRGLALAIAAALGAQVAGLSWQGILVAYMLGGCAGLLASALKDLRSDRMTE